MSLLDPQKYSFFFKEVPIEPFEPNHLAGVILAPIFKSFLILILSPN